MEEPTNTAVELARLSGRIDQVITDHARRLDALESRSGGTGLRLAAYSSPVVAAVALAVSVTGR